MLMVLAGGRLMLMVLAGGRPTRPGLFPGGLPPRSPPGVMPARSPRLREEPAGKCLITPGRCPALRPPPCPAAWPPARVIREGGDRGGSRRGQAPPR